MKPVIMGQAVKFAGKLVDFGVPVLEVLSTGDKHIVLVQSWESPKPEFSRGVFAYNDAGEQLWQIEGLEDDVPPLKFFWVGIRVDENGQLKARDFIDLELSIDLETGRIIRRK